MSRDGSSSRPINILHFVSTFQVKTDTKWLLQVARHFNPNTHKISIACFYDGGPMQDAFERLGVRTFNLQTPHERDPRAILRAKRLIDEHRPDIIHTHLLRADLFGGAAARWAGMPTVISTVYAVGAFRRSRRRHTDHLLDWLSSCLPTHVLAVSEAVKRDCVDRQGIDSDRVTVIHTGIDPPERFDASSRERCRCEWNIEPEQPLVVTVARLSYEKGIDTLIDAAALVCARHVNARFLVVGDGPDREQLGDRIRARGLNERIRLAGFHDDVWPFLAAADVFCLPSHSEGMPNALLEAMAVERAVVATKVGGIPEAVTHGHDGLLVPAGEPRALADAIARVISDGPLRSRLAREAADTVRARFLARDVAQRYAALYDRLLQGSEVAHAR